MVERQATANVIDVPVLIVGAGAAGLTASALLARHGISSLLVEKRRELFIYPKARNLSFRTLEILRGLGLGNQIHAVADRVSDSVVKPALNSSEERLGVDIDAVFSGFDTLSPEPPVQYCPQSKLEPILVGFTRDHGSDVRYGTELVTFTQDESAVTAEVRTLDSDRSQVVRARYLLAADGVHGQTRQTLGVSASGYGALPIYVVFIYFRAPGATSCPTSPKATPSRSRTISSTASSSACRAIFPSSSPPIFPVEARQLRSSRMTAAAG